MENKINLNSPKTGLLKLGYVTNLKSCKAELNELLTDEKQVSTAELNALVDRASIVYLNKYGYAQSRSGESVARKDAAYLYFETGLVDTTGNPIIGWFEKRGKEPTFKGVSWGTKATLDAKIRASRMFHWGDLYSRTRKKVLHSLRTSPPALSQRRGRSRTNLRLSTIQF